MKNRVLFGLSAAGVVCAMAAAWLFGQAPSKCG